MWYYNSHHFVRYQILAPNTIYIPLEMPMMTTDFFSVCVCVLLFIFPEMIGCFYANASDAAAPLMLQRWSWRDVMLVYLCYCIVIEKKEVAHRSIDERWELWSEWAHGFGFLLLWNNQISHLIYNHVVAIEWAVGTIVTINFNN